jgi:ssDNA-binding Zn-finger/Zn-ribbon topoisomerase 1
MIWGAKSNGSQLINREKFITMILKLNPGPTQQLPQVERICSRCGSNMVLRKGSKGEFYVAVHFPRARPSETSPWQEWTSNFPFNGTNIAVIITQQVIEFYREMVRAMKKPPHDGRLGFKRYPSKKTGSKPRTIRVTVPRALDTEEQNDFRFLVWLLPTPYSVLKDFIFHLYVQIALVVNLEREIITRCLLLILYISVAEIIL